MREEGGKNLNSSFMASFLFFSFLAETILSFFFTETRLLQFLQCNSCGETREGENEGEVVSSEGKERRKQSVSTAGSVAFLTPNLVKLPHGGGIFPRRRD